MRLGYIKTQVELFKGNPEKLKEIYDRLNLEYETVSNGLYIVIEAMREEQNNAR